MRIPTQRLNPQGMKSQGATPQGPQTKEMRETPSTNITETKSYELVPRAQQSKSNGEEVQKIQVKDNEGQMQELELSSKYVTSRGTVARLRISAGTGELDHLLKSGYHIEQTESNARLVPDWALKGGGGLKGEDVVLFMRMSMNEIDVHEGDKTWVMKMEYEMEADNTTLKVTGEGKGKGIVEGQRGEVRGIKYEKRYKLEEVPELEYLKYKIDKEVREDAVEKIERAAMAGEIVDDSVISNNSKLRIGGSQELNPYEYSPSQAGDEYGSGEVRQTIGMDEAIEHLEDQLFDIRTNPKKDKDYKYTIELSYSERAGRLYVEARREGTYKGAGSNEGHEIEDEMKYRYDLKHYGELTKLEKEIKGNLKQEMEEDLREGRGGNQEAPPVLETQAETESRVRQEMATKAQEEKAEMEKKMEAMEKKMAEMSASQRPSPKMGSTAAASKVSASKEVMAKGEEEARKLMGNNFVGRKEVEEYLDIKVSAPEIPQEILKAIEGPCEIRKGKQVKETHVLVLHPGEEWSVAHWDEVLSQGKHKAPNKEHAKFYWRNDDMKTQEWAKAKEKAKWVLMSKEVIPGSFSKTWDEKQEIAKGYESKGYETPRAGEVVSTTMLVYMKSGDMLFGDDYKKADGSGYTYTRTTDRTASGIHVNVGDFSSDGLYVFNYDDGLRDDSVGLGLIKRNSS